MNYILFINFEEIYQCSRTDLPERGLRKHMIKTLTEQFLGMKHIVLPDNKNRRLVFYLAMEEFVAKNMEEDAFFLWSVDPTVIIGRNQDLEAEVNMEYCLARGVQVYRRKSGGGCVYADRGNLMISAITGICGAESAFENYLHSLTSFLSGLGFDASRSGRNDILVEGRKVSGNALQMLPDKSIVHGTLLYDTDLNALECAIMPPVEKLARHGISSVRQRVANLKEFKSGTSGINCMEELMEGLVKHFCSGHAVLSQEDVKKIEEIEAGYLAPDFIKGKNLGNQ